MKIALLDLGSNTIKMAVYQLENSGFSQIYYSATYTYIITFIENGKLTAEGIEKLKRAIGNFKNISVNLKCSKIECFSTASLRYVSNIDEVISAVYAKTGIRITPISGEEEAHYNFLSMKLAAKQNSFLGADLGGGSMQIFSCENLQQGATESFPMGALAMYNSFVQGTFPTEKEACDIKNYVHSLLCSSDSFAGFSCKDLYIMGGTARMICRLLDSDDDNFSIEELISLIRDFLKNPQFAREQIEQTVPERLTTILPGMLVILTVCEYIGIKKIHYTQNSVREGYLVAKYLRKSSK